MLRCYFVDGVRACGSAFAAGSYGFFVKGVVSLGGGGGVYFGGPLDEWIGRGVGCDVWI